MPWNALKMEGGGVPQGSDGLHIVGWQHPSVAGALHGPIHPAIIDLLHVDDGVSILEGDLILISSTVVIHSTVPLLGRNGTVSWGPNAGSSEPRVGKHSVTEMCS